MVQRMCAKVSELTISDILSNLGANLGTAVGPGPTGDMIFRRQKFAAIPLINKAPPWVQYASQVA